MTSSPNVITITVKCDLDLDEIFGRVHVYTTADKSMDWILDEFCREKDVKRISTFALRSEKGLDYDLTKNIHESSLGNEDLIYCYNKNPPKAKPPPKSRSKGGQLCGTYCGLGILFLLIALAGLITVIVIYETQSSNKRLYAVVVDAGSTSSKIYLYSWPSSLIFNTGKVQQDVYYKDESPLSDFINNPSAAAAPIIDAIRSHIVKAKKIPKNQISSTPLYLGATAGMRMLRDRNETLVNNLYDVLRKDLQKMKFQILSPAQQIRIISGTEEGADGWITVNYLKGTLGKFINNVFRQSSGQQTFGSLDLGGASTQISYVPTSYDAVAAENTSAITNMTLYGRDYSLYSHSFLCYGKTQAQNRIFAILLQDQGYANVNVSNPCTPSGYSETLKASDFLLVPCSKGKHAIQSYGYEFNVPKTVTDNSTFTFYGLSDPVSCKQLTDRLFAPTACPYSQCSINGMYQPALHGNFKAFAGYYHVANFFNATETKFRTKATLQQYNSSVLRFCLKDWETIKSQYGNSKYVAHYCFDGLYVRKLLGMYGFHSNNTWETIDFVDKIKGSTVGWSLGFTILESGRIHVESLISLSLPLFIGLVVLFCIILIVSIVFVAVAIYNSRGRRYNANLNSDTAGYGSI